MKERVLRFIMTAFAIVCLTGMNQVKAQAKMQEPDLTTKTADYFIMEEAADKKGTVSAKIQNKLTVVEIPETVVIDDKEYTVTEITGLNYPDTLDFNLKQDAYKCKKNKKTTEIHLPKTLQKIEKGTFSNFSKLKKIVIDKDNKCFKVRNGAVLSKDGKILYGTLTIKGTYRIPRGVSKINDRAFAYSSVKKIILPSTCKKIGARAFYRCKNLKTVKNIKKVKKIGKGAFYGTQIKK